MVMLVAGLQACGTASVSKGLTDDGKAAEVVFPDAGRDAWIKEGTYPNPDNLRMIGHDISKRQLYALVGPPHFNEGTIGVREWDYLFNLRDPGTGKTTQCQYKIIFDKDYKGQSFYWKPAACQALVAQPPAPSVR